MHQMFSVQPRQEEFKNVAITGHLGFSCVCGKLGLGNHLIIIVTQFSRVL